MVKCQFEMLRKEFKRACKESTEQCQYSLGFVSGVIRLARALKEIDRSNIDQNLDELIEIYENDIGGEQDGL